MNSSQTFASEPLVSGLDGFKIDTIPTRLPEFLASDDLTERALAVADFHISPFASDPSYFSFFNKLHRGLHKSIPKHILLLRERGVGEQSVLMDLAIRCLRGEPPFLANRRILGIDLRFIAAEVSSRCHASSIRVVWYTEQFGYLRRWIRKNAAN